MFQTIRTPVHVFKSTDNNAPKLINAQGSLKTLLKACLVTGYGDKSSLEWAMPFEETNSAVFQSKTSRNQHFLNVDNNTYSNRADIALYRNMSGINQGSGKVNYSSGFDGDSLSDTNLWKYAGYERETRWMLIGNDRAFMLLLCNRAKTCSNVLFFGDVPSILPNDTGNTILWSNFNPSGDGDLGAWFWAVNTNLGGKPALFSTNHKHDITPTKCVFWVQRGTRSALSAPYPDPISGGFTAMPVYLGERPSDSAVHIRAVQCGLLDCMNVLNLPEWMELTADGSDDVFMRVSMGLANSEHYLVNCTAWEMPL